MKYLVSTGAVLRFEDGSQVVLSPGIHSFEKHVADHWAFKAHAVPVGDSEEEGEKPDTDLIAKVSALETEIIDLKAQVSDKDGEIIDLKAQVDALKQPAVTDAPPVAEVNAVQAAAEQKETGNAKKQSSANK